MELPLHSSAPVTTARRTIAGGLHGLRDLAPGLGIAALGVAVSYAAHQMVATISVLTFAVVVGALLANLPVPLDRLQPGLDFAAKHILRLGIVLLGLRLAVTDLLQLGIPNLVVVVVVVVATFFGTQWLGRKVGLSSGSSLLIATGFSICGASAVAAMDGVSRNKKEDVATAIAVVTIFGSLAILVLPLLQHPLGLSDTAFGTWAGASVHDVGQTVATASAAGSSALAAAVVVKLTRVVLLAPMVAGVSLWQRRSMPRVAGRARPPIIPLFVLGFLAAVALRSTSVLSNGVLSAAADTATLALAAALFGLGTSVNLRVLVRTGGRALAVGLAAWIMVCAVAYAGIRLVG